MKLRAFNLLVALAMLLGIAACGEKPVPTKTVSATDHKQTAPPSDSTVAERISRLMEFYDKSGQFGGAILVAQDGNIIYEDAFGWANLEWRIPNALDTRFRIASITYDEACQVLESYVDDSYFKTAEIRQKLAEYCE